MFNFIFFSDIIIKKLKNKIKIGAFMNRVLIFYGSYGGGHLAAAKSIAECLRKENPSIEIQMIDCIEAVNKYVNKISTDAYKEVTKNFPFMWELFYNGAQEGPIAKISTRTMSVFSQKIYNLIKEFNPDLIISTHFFSSQMCTTLKKKKKINTKIATILTDYEIHNLWLYLPEYTDYFFVSNSIMKEEMIKKGIPAEKIHVTGIPISPRFLQEHNKDEIYSKLDFSKNKKTVLFFAGGEFGLGGRTTVMVFKVLLRLFKDTQVIAISGKNHKMKAKFEKLIESTDSSQRVKLIEFSNEIPELMSISDLVITKPGGLTVTESLVSNLPIIIINPIPGQEEGNAEFLVNNELGIWIKKEDNVARKFKNLYRNPEILDKMRENAKKLAKPNSTEDICKILLEKNTQD